jgi:hypothetical protein
VRTKLTTDGHPLPTRCNLREAAGISGISAFLKLLLFTLSTLINRRNEILSVIAPALKRPWLPIVVIVLVVGAVSAVVSSRLLDSPAPPPGPRPGTIAAPDVEQAAWKIHARPMGALEKLSRRERVHATDAGRRVGAVIKEIYNALFLEPAGIRAAVRASFTRSAGAALLATKAGLPRNARDVRTTVRRADISVQVPRPRRAVAEVRVVARGEAGDSFRVVHRAALYLERDRSGWRVIAFDIDEGRGK